MEPQEPNGDALAAASAVVIGAGALGTVAAQQIAAGGIGRIGIVDPALAAGEQSRAEATAGAVYGLHSGVLVEPYPALLEQANAEAIIGGYDVAVDCTNDTLTRALASDACVGLRMPLVVAAVAGGRGLVTTVVPGEGACARCSERELADALAGTEGSQPAVAVVLGALAALEAAALVAGTGGSLAGRALLLDTGGMSASELKLDRDPGCALCSPGRDRTQAVL